MTDAEIRGSLTDREVVGLTVFGEARGERPPGRLAVAWVIRNRVRLRVFGDSYRAVCLAPWQFSCWQPVGGPGNAATVAAAARALRGDGRLAFPVALRACLEVADEVLAGTGPDPTGGAAYYLTAALLKTRPPFWSRTLTETARIGAHVFFK